MAFHLKKRSQYAESSNNYLKQNGGKGRICCSWRFVNIRKKKIYTLLLVLLKDSAIQNDTNKLKWCRRCDVNINVQHINAQGNNMCGVNLSLCIYCIRIMGG